VIDTSVEFNQTQERAKLDYYHEVSRNKNRLNFSHVIQKREINFFKDFEDLITYFLNKFDNLISIDCSVSKWKVLDTAETKIKQRISAVQNHRMLSLAGKAAPIFNSETKPSEIIRKIGKFGKYCPVIFVDQNEIVLGNTSCIAEYQGKYYKCFGKNEYFKSYLVN
jgi:hypothetical protein